jgi:hypothetical protein
VIAVASEIQLCHGKIIEGTRVAAAGTPVDRKLAAVIRSNMF